MTLIATYHLFIGEAIFIYINLLIATAFHPCMFTILLSIRLKRRCSPGYAAFAATREAFEYRPSPARLRRRLAVRNILSRY